MSDQSETSSVNGEWEQICQCSRESFRDERVNELRRKMERMEEDMRQKEEDNKQKDTEIETIKAENSLLKKMIEKNNAQNDKGNKRQLEEDVGAIFRKLGVKTMEMVKEQRESGMAEEPLAKENTNSIDRFLGIYHAANHCCFVPWNHIDIAKYDDGYYEVCFARKDGSISELTWIPDNVERDGVRAWIEGDILYLRNWGTSHRYELCDSGLKLNGELYVRG